MDTHALDNLEEWGGVLEELDRVKHDRLVDEYQKELLRILRFQDNWRMRKAALEALREVYRPSEPLVEEACRIMMNEGLYHRVRVLAAEVLAAMGERLAQSRERRLARLRSQVGRQMQELLDSQQPPVLHQAVRRIMPMMRSYKGNA
ncbi:MAG TPA: hypothetical protein PKY77_00180 [Phycisphaerae bacterium]|nr:hypothetical protein [Phycisphaerae bacterium]HRY69686.1 hypothetical protein [Phycisphaerae bacterium]HSA25117.1 hypothetical protein [Phycisphaerae bacterium]